MLSKRGEWCSWCLIVCRMVGCFHNCYPVISRYPQSICQTNLPPSGRPQNQSVAVDNPSAASCYSDNSWTSQKINATIIKLPLMFLNGVNFGRIWTDNTCPFCPLPIIQMLPISQRHFRDNQQRLLEYLHIKTAI